MGYARFCVGGRIRHGDGNRIEEEPTAEPKELLTDDNVLGFLEVVVDVTKTSQRKARRDGTPITAHSW